jgi:uncharacterized protein (DUF302 family)
LASLVLGLSLTGAALAQSPPGAASQPAAATPSAPASQAPWFTPIYTPFGAVFMQQAAPPPLRDYQMSRILEPAEKRRMMDLAMPMMSNMMKLDAREAMNYFAIKYKARAGLTFDEVVESLLLRGNKLNFKHVGTNLMWKDFRAVLGDEAAPRIEVFSFCDIAVGRKLIKLIPEMVIFLPCRITVMEDADKNIWVLSMDWDVTWLDQAGKAMGVTPELRTAAVEIRKTMDEMMRAAANGEL